MRKLSLPQTHWLTDRTQSRRALCDEAGFTLIEMLVAAVLTIVIASAALVLYDTASDTEKKNVAYGLEINSTQGALATLLHDLRGAVAINSVGPGVLSFQMIANGTTYNVQYDCSAQDSLGSPYTRCARTQAVAPALPSAAGSTAGTLDIQHVYNNPSNTAGGSFATFCNTGGTASSGAVFFVSNSTVANTDGSGLACDEAYEDVVAAHPIYVQVRVQVPASGDLTSGGLKHYTVLQGGTFLPNLDAGS